MSAESSDEEKREEIIKEEKKEEEEEKVPGNWEETWKAHLFPHGVFQVLIENELWQIEGSLKSGIKRNMLVYKMKTGGLFLHSVVALNKEGMEKLESFGKPEIILVPNAQHTIDCVIYKLRYPNAKLITPETFRMELEKKKGVKFDGIAQEIPKSTGVSALVPEGSKTKGAYGLGGEMTYELELSTGRGLVFCDLMMNQVGNKGLKKALLGNSFICPRIVRWFVLQDKYKFREWISRFASWDNLKVISVSHGPPITKDINQSLKEAISKSF